MKRQPRVVWTKGMFLSPQHFQAQDLYFEDLIHFRLGASQFANYGVTRIEIDTEALANGLFKLIAAQGLMPDGEVFDMPNSDELPASREFARHWPTSNETLNVYLSLPERRLNARNVTLVAQQGGAGPADSRYTSETRMVPDDNQGSDEKPVQLGKKTFRLLFDTEFRDGYSSLRIGQLERSPTGVPMMRPSFVAPCLDLASSEYLVNVLRRQVEILLTKSASLSGPRRERGKAAAGFSTSETDKFWLLHTVNSYLPELKHIFKTRHGHPEGAYVAMLRLAGALSTFSLEGGPGDLPDYDHDDLGPCFTKLDARVRDLMEIVIPSKYRSIPLSLTGRSIWSSGAIEDDKLFKDSKFYLAVSSSMGVADLIHKVPMYVKMSAPDDIDRLMRTSVTGVGLVHTQVVPPAIPMRLENQYFQINQNGALWEHIMLARRIAVYAPGEIVEPRMEVVVVWE
jgi:type VI secretion system protein ImpJ